MYSYYENMRSLILSSIKKDYRPYPTRTIYTFDCSSTPEDEYGTPIKDFFNNLKSKFKKKEINTTKPKNDPIETPDEEPRTGNISAFTSFSGADMIVTVDNKVVGEIESLYWYKPHDKFLENLDNSDFYDKSLAKQYPIVLLAKFALFDTVPKDLNLNDANITITFANEYGKNTYRGIYDVITINEIGGCNVDSIMAENYFTLAAKSISDFKPGVEYSDDKK